MEQLRDTVGWQQAAQHKHPEIQYQLIADSLNKAASTVFGEKQSEDPTYQEVKNKRMELLDKRRKLRLQLHICDEDTMCNLQLELVMVGRRARK